MKATKLVPVFSVLAAIGIAVSIYLVFFQAPLQYGYTTEGRLNGSSLFFNRSKGNEWAR